MKFEEAEDLLMKAGDAMVSAAADAIRDAIDQTSAALDQDGESTLALEERIDILLDGAFHKAHDIAVAHLKGEKATMKKGGKQQPEKKAEPDEKHADLSESMKKHIKKKVDAMTPDAAKKLFAADIKKSTPAGIYVLELLKGK